jgi:hypothetical protein
VKFLRVENAVRRRGPQQRFVALHGFTCSRHERMGPLVGFVSRTLSAR